ncbi:hypothetical protein Kpho01_34680 [Kitasatospora phosalacinea]|uniref:Uncharacterized protein n=1 Tax=Kitasatospora phosalacinea TaxID=2065 RepID=A0A9W6PIH5_9ACTN|nr:hypothetical protein Kpho01_34680 [Kitasatospora phosalacinea]
MTRVAIWSHVLPTRTRLLPYDDATDLDGLIDPVIFLVRAAVPATARTPRTAPPSPPARLRDVLGSDRERGSIERASGTPPLALRSLEERPVGTGRRRRA